MNASLTIIERPRHQSELALAYQDLDWKSLLSLYGEIFNYSMIDEFFADHTNLTENEMAVLSFLYAHRQDSPGTRMTYAQHLCRFLNAVKLNFYEVQVRHVDSFLDKLIKEEKGKNSIKLALSAVRSFYKRMQAANKTITNPVQFVAPPKTSNSDKIAHVLKKSLSQNTVDLILDYLEENAPPRNTVIFYLLARTGLRVSELCGLRWEHLFLSSDKWALSVHGKGDKERIVFLPQNGVFYLLHYRFRVFGISPDAKSHLSIAPLPIFSNYRNLSVPLQRRAINKIMAKIAVETNTQHFSPHGLRHTCFTQLSHMKTPINAIKLLAGHESIKTTSIYIDAGETMASGATDFDKTERRRNM